MALVKETREFRIFDCKKDAGSIVTLRVRKANRRELECADMEQGRIYNQALLAGLPPRMRMLRKLREQDLWTSEDDSNLNELREAVARLDVQVAEQIKKLQGDLNETAKAEITAVKEGLSKDRADAFRKLSDLRSEIDGMLGHTSDAKAEDINRNFLLACVTEYVQIDGDTAKATGRVWDSVDTLMNEQDTNLLQRAIYEHMTFNAGIPSEWPADTQAKEPDAAPVATPEPAPVKTEPSPASGGNAGEARASAGIPVESL